MKLTYDETLPGCAGYIAYEAFTGYGSYAPSSGSYSYNDDCFQWYNTTSVANGYDLTAQVQNAYKTGLNKLGQTVGTAHPGFDLGWMGGGQITVSDGGYCWAFMRTYKNSQCIVAGVCPLW